MAEPGDAASGRARRRALVAVPWLVVLWLLAEPLYTADAEPWHARRVVIVAAADADWTDLMASSTLPYPDAAGLANLALHTVRRRAGIRDTYLTLGAGSQIVLPARAPLPPGKARSPAVSGWVEYEIDTSRLPTVERTGARADVDAFGRALDRHGRSAGIVLGSNRSPERRDTVGLAIANNGRYRDFTTARATPMAAFDEALRESDVVVVDLPALPTNAIDLGLLHHIEQSIDLSRDALVVLSSSSPGLQRDLGVVAVRGPGINGGRIDSPSTRRPGLAVVSDVSPTVLRLLDIGAPSSMTGQAWVGTGEGSASIVDELVEERAAASIRDQTVGPVSIALAAWVVLVALAFAAETRWPRVSAITAPLALGVLGWLPVLFAVGALPFPFRSTPFRVATVSLLGAGVAAVVLVRWLDARRGAMVLVSALAALLVVDVRLGGALQINTTFGYSPTIGGRFYGLGNPAFALLVASALLSVARRSATAGAPRAEVYGWGAALVIALAHPGLGADVGGIFAVVPALVVLLLNRNRSDRGRARRLALAAAAAVAATAAVVLGAVALDLLTPSPGQSHLATFAAQLLAGDSEAAAATIARKATANLTLLLSTWGFLVVACVLLAVLARLARRRFAAAVSGDPSIRQGLAAIAVAALLGSALNDSGVVVTALMAVVAVPAVAVLAPRPPAVSAP